MNDESLANVMAKLEQRIGKTRMSVLRITATKKGVSVISLLSTAVVQYVEQLSKEVDA